VPTYTPTLDGDELADWREIVQHDLRWDGLLLGNGASVAVWEPFAYPSLYDQALSAAVADPLTPADVALFDILGTRNFELVLGALKNAARVEAALGEPEAHLRERYDHIQRALFQAVAAVHVGWSAVEGERLLTIRRALSAYRAVFSTNYDLLAYWAVMHDGQPPGSGFKDFFWSGPDAHGFDAANTGVSGNTTLIYYLHGGIHLRTSTGGGTHKRVPTGSSLLDDFEIGFDSEELPLLVSEGTASDKLAAIRRSDYLSFAYQTFAEHRGGLVIFGHSLGASDDHLVDVIKSWRPPWRSPLIAIGVRPSAEHGRVRQRKLELAARLPDSDLLFFDPQTHPLGSATLLVPVA
jgi:Domain of unknown function (DUF4917)